MADIELVIKIPEEEYMLIKQKMKLNVGGVTSEAEQIIANGTPLPKGHGELIDKSKICKAIPADEDNCTGMGMSDEEMDAYNEGIDAMYSLVKGARPIIEADKAESGE